MHNEDPFFYKYKSLNKIVIKDNFVMNLLQIKNSP